MDIFISNKYTKWYNSLIERRIDNIPDGYHEIHHIIPRCMGGNDTKSNLVALTAREHVTAHWLLTKMVNGVNRYKMEHALHAMSRISKNQERKLTPIQVERCRIAKSIAMKNTVPLIVTDLEVREKWYDAMREVNSRPEVKTKRSESAKRARANPETIEKMKLTMSSTEYKQKQSNSSRIAQNCVEVKHKKSEALKKYFSNAESRLKSSLAAKECQNRPAMKLKKSEKLKSQIYVCPHCNKTGTGPAMFRHHFDRCRNITIKS